MTTDTPDTLRNKAFDAVQLALGDAYECIRTWSAWNEGTMGQDDFRPIFEDFDRCLDIADSVLDAVGFGTLLEELDELRQERDRLRKAIIDAVNEIRDTVIEMGREVA